MPDYMGRLSGVPIRVNNALEPNQWFIIAGREPTDPPLEIIASYHVARRLRAGWGPPSDPAILPHDMDVATPIGARSMPADWTQTMPPLTAAEQRRRTVMGQRTAEWVRGQTLREMLDNNTGYGSQPVRHPDDNCPIDCEGCRRHFRGDGTKAGRDMD